MKTIFTSLEAIQGLPTRYFSEDFFVKKRSAWRNKGQKVPTFRSIKNGVNHGDFSEALKDCCQIIGDSNLQSEAVCYWKGSIVFILNSGFPAVDWKTVLPEMKSTFSGGEPPIIALSTKALIKALG